MSIPPTGSPGYPVAGPRPGYPEHPQRRSRRAVVVVLLALAVLSAGASVYVFVSGDESTPRAASVADKNPATAPAVAIKAGEAKKARTRETDRSNEPVCGPTTPCGPGTAVQFTDGLAVRVDAIEKAELWPNSKEALAYGDRGRPFAIRYTYTNLSDQPLEVRPGHELKNEPFEVLQWPKDVTGYFSVVNSNSASMPEGISELRPDGTTRKRDPIFLQPGESIKGVHVAVEIRTGEAKLRLMIGRFRGTGQAVYDLIVP